MPPRNVLIFHLGALGDFVLTWPLALALARLHPQSRIIYITHQQKGRLAEHVLRIESADIEAGFHHLFSDASQLPPQSARLLAGAHSIYSFIAAPDDQWSRQVLSLAPHADLCCLRPTPPADYPGHYTDHLLQQLASRKALAEAVRQMLLLANSRGLSPRPPQGTTLTLHPGSGSPRKCWPADRFLELAEHFNAAGKPPRILLGETELERWPQSQIYAFRQVGQVHTPPTCLELWNLLAQASLFIGNDSGPSHLAGLLPVPTLALFGPTSPATWKPLGPDVQTIAHDPLDDLAASQVIQAIESWSPAGRIR